VIKKPRERGGHSPRWAAKLEKILIMIKMMIIIIIIIIIMHKQCTEVLSVAGSVT
jgi:cell division protein FtsL